MFLLNFSVGWFARDPSILCQVGHALLNLSAVAHKRQRSLIFADDLFELSDIPKQKSVHVVRKAIENLPGCKFAFVLFPSLNLLKIHILLLNTGSRRPNSKTYKR